MNNTKNKMLIDSTHPEETRVVVLRNGRIEEFDWESAARKLLRGNIYLAKVTRVEPSLQAAFVDYGGNRHGFLAFSEIHPDYYQIPMADRQALIEEEAEAEEAKAKAEEAEDAALPEADDDDGTVRGGRHQSHRTRGHADADLDGDRSSRDTAAGTPHQPESAPENHQPATDWAPDQTHPAQSSEPVWQPFPEPFGSQNVGDSTAGEAPRSLPFASASPVLREDAQGSDHRSDRTDLDASGSGSGHSDHDRHGAVEEPHSSSEEGRGFDQHGGYHGSDDATDLGSRVVEVVEPEGSGAAEVETVGSEDAVEEIPDRPRRHARQYKIQEVIRRRQIILVQVVKEERGNKGAALTTYLSLAGRYTVLMPNTARGGGISRKIANSADRKRLRKIVTELEVPKGMGLIVRTAGATRTKAEIKRDFEYLLRLWESVRDLTLRSTAPALVYEEGDLIKRSIRDLYSKEIEDITVAGEQAYASARDFMQMLMPSHVGNVIAYRAPEPLFTKYQIERQLNAMFSPFVTLRSGGYIVINQTEALVSIDINSGKSTREHNIEDTALKTNLEASEEIARQLKLRDLAGLIVIDYIDMEEKRNNRAVERRMKESLRHDRARIQVGRISHFGLLEMSRQRLRPGVLEGSTTQCPHCQGTGTIRSTESVALAVLRGIEDKMMSGERFNVLAQTTADVALYILNQKRHFLNDMEGRYGVTITIVASDKVHGANFVIERGPANEERQPVRRTDVVQMDASHHGVQGSWDAHPDDEEEEVEDGGDAADELQAHDAGGEGSREQEDSGGEGEGERRGRRRRRRRRTGRNGVDGSPTSENGADGAHRLQSDEASEHREGGHGDHDHAGHGHGHGRDGDHDGEASVQEVFTDAEIETIGGDDYVPEADGGEGQSPDRAGGRIEEGERSDADRGGEGRRRRRGRRGGRRSGREREGREGVTADGAEPGLAGPPPQSQEFAIARPDEWMPHEPTIGDLAAAHSRLSGDAEQPSYYSSRTAGGGGETVPPADAPGWQRADTSSYPQVMSGSSGHVVTAPHLPGTSGYASSDGGGADNAFGSRGREGTETRETAPVSGQHVVGTHVPEARPSNVMPAHPDPTHQEAVPSPAWQSSPTIPPAPQAMPEDAVARELRASVDIPAREPEVAPPLPPEPPRPRKSGWWSRRLSG